MVVTFEEVARDIVVAWLEHAAPAHIVGGSATRAIELSNVRDSTPGSPTEIGQQIGDVFKAVLRKVKEAFDEVRPPDAR